MKFFFDNNLSQYLAHAMDLLEQEGKVIHLKDEFQPNTKDEDWLKYVGKKAMILITRDKKIRRHAAELRAFTNHKVGAFILSGSINNIWQIVRQVINNWLEIKDLASRTRPPFAFQVPLRGKIKQLPL